MKHYRLWPHLRKGRFLLNSHSLRLLRYITPLLIIFLSSLLFAQSAFAQPKTPINQRTTDNQTTRMQRAANDGPNLSQVSAGFDARFHDGNWIPVRVTLDNTGSDFQGSVAVNVPNSVFGNTNAVSTYQIPVSLPSGAHKQVTLYAPFTFGAQGLVRNINVNLLDTNGQTISSQVASLRTLNSSDIFVGVLSDQGNNFAPLSNVTLPSTSSSIIVQQLDATTLPDNSVVLRNFDLIVLDNFNTATLSQQQLNTLQNWVNQGGSLIVVGGPEWQRTLKPLPSGLLPVSLNGIATLPAGTSVLPADGPTSNGTNKVSSNPSSSIPISTATLTSGTSVLSSGSTPLIAQSLYGQGTVIYLAFDPSLDPINNWSGASTLWKGLLFRTVSEQQFMGFQGANGTVPSGTIPRNKPAYLGFNPLLQTLLPNTVPAIWMILVLLLAYILILGPGRMLLVRILKKRDWSWRITLITVIVFSLLSYGLALVQQGTSIESDSISIVQLGNEGVMNNAPTPAHITTFQGVFVPNQGDYQLHIPQASLVQQNDGPSYGGGTSSVTTIASSANANDVTLHGVNIWTLRSVVSERDQNLRGGITSHLSIVNGSLQGTVTNTLPYTLSDVYVLIGNQYVGLGKLASGQTTSVQLPVTNNYDPLSNISIASQIANANNLPSNYGPYTGQQPQTDFQRHLAVMSVLSGNGVDMTYCANGTCYTSSNGAAVYVRSAPIGAPIIVKSGTVILSGGGPYTQFHANDPLAIPGAPATLIGWADGDNNAQSDIVGNVTINGNAATGHQEILIQAPLSVGFSGTFSLNATLTQGQLVDTQGTGTQALTNGIYMMNNGSVTYEYTVPGLAHIQGNKLTIAESANLSQIAQPASNGNAPSDANSLQVQVYNWQKQTWDSFSFTQFSLSIGNAQAYVRSDGRVLIKLSNSDSSKTILFNKPLLSLQGSIQ